MAKEDSYIEHFYGKHQGRIAIGVGYGPNMAEIYPFVFENPDGESIGIAALGIFSNGRKGVHIYHLGAFISQQGSGTIILKELCRQADLQNILLSVSAVSMPTGKEEEIEEGNLIQWYRSFGFEGNGKLMRLPCE